MPVDKLSEKIQVFLSAEGLPNVQMLNKTDAFAVVTYQDPWTKETSTIVTTEVIRDNHSPVWTTTVTVDYFFETVQDLVVRVYQQKDLDSPLLPANHSLIGESHFRLSDLVRNASRLSLTLHHDENHSRGTVHLRSEAVVDSRDVFVLTLSGHKLVNKDGFFNTSDPFYTISRLNEDNTFTVVHRSETIDNDLNPKWKEVKIPMVTLCNGDYDRPLLIEIRDKDNDGKSELMGSVRTSVRALLAANGSAFDVLEADKKDKKGYKNSGTLTAMPVRIEHHPTFSQFLMGGLEMNLTVAIDFTGSNGDPELTSSLHYVDCTGQRHNAYEDAILSVGKILQAYDTDKTYPVLGFGARVKEEDGSYSAVSHHFPVDRQQPAAHGLQEILSIYHRKVKDLMFSGPTLIAPLIESAAQASRCVAGDQKYSVLLILTDGTINDMDEAKAALIAASHKPISVIIVGIGGADFTDMRVLDSDKKALTTGKQTAARDIVQFVVYNEGIQRGPTFLAEQVLAELPNQVLRFMELHNILPGAKR